MSDTFTCEACGDTYSIAPESDPVAEAEAVFSPAELADAGIVCDDCWQAMRRDMPDFDARYRAAGL